uniref:Uncharacterized protein n=1 Tax=Siphoviridae sp. ctNLX12 TaxID=2825469 RepID=A0A8S5UDJ1_9CAUD|nr:MAG TPA: hypothetical protein [Siphoviridae sp. ctNLX12]
MRVISQDGTLDMPYEEVIIQRFKSRIYFLNKNLIGVESLNEDMQIAEYSTEEKAKKAVEMLRDAYIGMPIVMQNVDISEDVAREFERLKKCGIMVQTENQPSKIECISNAIFHFPAEEELE